MVTKEIERRAAMANEPLVMSPKQREYYRSTARFVVVPAGRRSGKTAIAKRRLRKKALSKGWATGTRFIAAGPTLPQAKRIYWQDFQLMFPEKVRRAPINKTDLIIPLITGADVQVMGMEVPERTEGAPIGHILGDEYGNWKEKAWTQNIYPALMDTQGSADLIGVPEGRNHYFRTWQYAISGEDDDWEGYTWYTEDVLPYYLGEEIAKKEIKMAQRRLDIATYRQEYNASFENFSGRIYYCYDRNVHSIERLYYNPNRPLIFCFDFNSAPGVAAVCQEQTYKGDAPDVSPRFTACIDEVWISSGSNTRKICHELIKKWGRKHKVDIHVYGDATGAAKGSSAVDGSDWDIVFDELRSAFGSKVKDRVSLSNPRERVRINAVNSRLQTADGTISMLVDSTKCPKLCDDLDGVMVKPDTDGEVDKDTDKTLTHISDALGYYIVDQFPVSGSVVFGQHGV